MVDILIRIAAIAMFLGVFALAVHGPIDPIEYQIMRTDGLIR